MTTPAAPDDEARRKLVKNEQLKLIATASNNLAVAFVVTGCIAPGVALAYLISTPHGQFWSAFLALWIIFGVSLHMIGRFTLKGLAP